MKKIYYLLSITLLIVQMLIPTSVYLQSNQNNSKGKTNTKTLKLNTPIITNLSQNSARLEGGQEIIITGNNFSPDPQLTLGDGVVTKLTVKSPTMIRFTTPKVTIIGDVNLTVRTIHGIAQQRFTILPKPLSELSVGEITSVAGGVPFLEDGSLATSPNIALTVANTAIDKFGNIFVADFFNNRVRRIDSQTGIITTVAGTGLARFTGDGELATSASLSNPLAVAVDQSGNIFIADSFNNRIRKVDSKTGIITTIAGTGCILADCPLGDGGLAINAKLASPEGLAIDKDGNIFIADSGSSKIRKIDSQTGIITSVAGNGQFGYSGDGGLAINASFKSPQKVVVDEKGNLFIADGSNNRIRKIDSQTGIITTIAGNGCDPFAQQNCPFTDGVPATSTSLTDPKDLAIDEKGNLFIADGSNDRIRKIDSQTGIITTIAGNGCMLVNCPVEDGQLAINTSIEPKSLALDKAGNIFISDNNLKVRKIDAQTSIITTVAGRPGSAEDGESIVNDIFNEVPPTIIINSNNTSTANDNNKTEKVTGKITIAVNKDKSAFTQEGVLAIRDILRSPQGIALDKEGNIFISDGRSMRVKKVDNKTGIITTIAGNGLQGTSQDGKPATSVSINPVGLVVDKEGNVLIADIRNNKIRKVNSQTGIITTVAGNGCLQPSPNCSLGDGQLATKASLNVPTGLALDDDGNIFIADLENSRIRKVDGKTGIISTVAGNGKQGITRDGDLAINASLDEPCAVAVDKNGNIFIVNRGLDSSRVRKVDSKTGIITTVAGNGKSSFNENGDGKLAINASVEPSTLVLDEANNLFIVEFGNSKIRKVDRITGIITTVAGSGCNPFSKNCPFEDGGLATNANITFPSAIAIDKEGNMFIADSFNNRIRVVKGLAKTLEKQTQITIKSPDQVTIKEVIFTESNLTIIGSGFKGLSPNIKVNGIDISNFITRQIDSQIILKASYKQLALKKGNNSIVVTLNNISSNNFSFDCCK